MTMVTATRFAPIPRQTVASAVRDAIEREIRSGAIVPGHPLPSERELSEQFDVARTSVREAVQGLLMLGLIEKRGNRSYVVERLPEVRLDGDDQRAIRVQELFAVRQILERPIARLAAIHADDGRRAEIQRIADGFVPGMALDDFRRLDREFHWTLATSCGNSLLAELLGKVLDSLFSCEQFNEMLSAKANDAAVHDIIAESSAAHRRLARAVIVGDAALAEAEIEAHLGDVEDRMVSRMR
jgi:GntR family transcriptional repressor for pyruvate dehydrogenase complex